MKIDIIVMSMNNEVKPKNFGMKWTKEERDYVLKTLDLTKDMDDIIDKISKKLERTEGGVRCEIRKMIISSYLEGEEYESISEILNISMEYIKMTIKKYLEKNAEDDIKILERENNLLKLRIENAKLQNELKKELNSV